jgi:hypothetical protein
MDKNLTHEEERKEGQNRRARCSVGWQSGTAAVHLRVRRQRPHIHTKEKGRGRWREEEEGCGRTMWGRQ